MKMTLITLAASILVTTAQAECIVADPTPTPLNARTAPNGRIIATLDNGQQVMIIDRAQDERMRPWVYVSDPETNNPIGWVYCLQRGRRDDLAAFEMIGCRFTTPSSILH